MHSLHNRTYEYNTILMDILSVTVYESIDRTIYDIETPPPPLINITPCIKLVEYNNDIYAQIDTERLVADPSFELINGNLVNVQQLFGYYASSAKAGTPIEVSRYIVEESNGISSHIKYHGACESFIVPIELPNNIFAMIYFNPTNVGISGSSHYHYLPPVGRSPLKRRNQTLENKAYEKLNVVVQLYSGESLRLGSQEYDVYSESDASLSGPLLIYLMEQICLGNDFSKENVIKTLPGIVTLNELHDYVREHSLFKLANYLQEIDMTKIRPFCNLEYLFQLMAYSLPIVTTQESADSSSAISTASSMTERRSDLDGLANLMYGRLMTAFYDALNASTSNITALTEIKRWSYSGGVAGNSMAVVGNGLKLYFSPTEETDEAIVKSEREVAILALLANISGVLANGLGLINKNSPAIKVFIVIQLAIQLLVNVCRVRSLNTYGALTSDSASRNSYIYSGFALILTIIATFVTSPTFNVYVTALNLAPFILEFVDAVYETKNKREAKNRQRIAHIAPH